jgi:hypothetical protein
MPEVPLPSRLAMEHLGKTRHYRSMNHSSDYLCLVPEQCPVDCVENVADCKETNRGDEEVEEVESMVLCVGLLEHHLIKVLDGRCDVWN